MVCFGYRFENKKLFPVSNGKRRGGKERARRKREMLPFPGQGTSFCLNFCLNVRESGNIATVQR